MGWHDKENWSPKEHEMVEKYIRVIRLQRKTAERELSSTGVFRSQHQILMHVSENPYVSQKELAKMHGVSSATIAVSIKKLEQGGYIRKEMDEEDNRFNKICLTEKGEQVVKQSICIFGKIEKQLFLGFSQEDFQTLGNLLDRMHENLQEEIRKITRRKERAYK